MLCDAIPDALVLARRPRAEHHRHSLGRPRPAGTTTGRVLATAKPRLT